MSNTRVSMERVAERAGVSKTTVSFILNNRKVGISEETRARVLKACEETGYRLNPNIQDLVRESVSGSTRNIALVLIGKEFADPAYARLIDGVARGTAENNYHMLFAKLRGNEESFYDLPPILRDDRIDGALISAELSERSMSLLRKMNKAFVILGNYSESLTKGCSVVEVGFSIGSHMVVDQLKSIERKRIAFFAETLDYHSDKENFASYKEALEVAGYDVDEDIIYIGDGPFTGAMPLLRSVFEKEILPFDAIYCPDFRSAIEISHLIMGHFWGRKIDMTLATMRPYSYYRLPVPAVYLDSLAEEVAYQGVELLLDGLSQRENYRPRKVVMTPVLMASDQA